MARLEFLGNKHVAELIQNDLPSNDAIAVKIRSSLQKLDSQEIHPDANKYLYLMQRQYPEIFWREVLVYVEENPGVFEYHNFSHSWGMLIRKYDIERGEKYFPPIPTDEADIIETAFRYAINPEDPSLEQLQNSNTFHSITCLAIDDRIGTWREVFVTSFGGLRDPDRKFMRRFRLVTDWVKKASDCDKSSSAVKMGERPATLLSVERVRWLNRDMVKVRIRGYRGFLNSWGAVFKVKRQGETWLVETAVGTSVS